MAFVAPIASTFGQGGRSTVSGKTAVVFGAYGFIGRYVVNRLARQGHQVVVPHRCDPYDIRHLRPAGDLGVVRPVYFDPRSNNDIDLVTRGADTVYNLIGQESGTSNWPLEQVHVDLAGRLAAFSTKNNVNRFIQMSSVGASVDSLSDYYKTKAEGENIVREKFPRATIIRSARIFGAEDKLTNRIATTFQRLPDYLPLPIPNGGEVIRAPIYVGDVAQALVEVMSNRQSPGKTYELVGPEWGTARTFIGEVSEMVMREHFIGHLPHEVLRTVGPVVNPLSVYLLKSNALHKDIIDQQVIDEVPSDADGLAELGVTATPFRTVGLRWLRRFRPPHYAQHAMADADFRVTHK